MLDELGARCTQLALIMAILATDVARVLSALSDIKAAMRMGKRAQIGMLTRSQAMLSSSRIFTATCSAVALQVASHTWTSQHTSVRNPLTAHGRVCMFQPERSAADKGQALTMPQAPFPTSFCSS